MKVPQQLREMIMEVGLQAARRVVAASEKYELSTTQSAVPLDAGGATWIVTATYNIDLEAVSIAAELRREIEAPEGVVVPPFILEMMQAAQDDHNDYEFCYIVPVAWLPEERVPV